MDAKLVNPFIDAFITVMPQIGFPTPKRTKVFLADKNAVSKGVVVMVGFTKQIRGNVVYNMHEDTAKFIASTMMMGMPISEFDAMAQSAISELSNMLTANTATNLTNLELEVDGIAVIIGLTGNPTGRAITYMSMDTMKVFSKTMLGTDNLTDEEFNDAVEEAANIIVGRGVSNVNDVFKDKELRITPPGTICGEGIRIASPKLTTFKITAKTDFGEVCVNIGFAEGE